MSLLSMVDPVGLYDWRLQVTVTQVTDLSGYTVIDLVWFYLKTVIVWHTYILCVCQQCVMDSQVFIFK